MWSSHTHTHTPIVNIIRSLFFILTLSHASTITIITHICMHMRAFSCSLALGWSLVYMCTHRLTFVYIHLWLDCGPFRNSSMDFYGRLCAYRSLPLVAVPLFRFRVVAVLRICCCCFLWFVFLCLRLGILMIVGFFHIILQLYCFFKWWRQRQWQLLLA